jgi:hypothetical protein
MYLAHFLVAVIWWSSPRFSCALDVAAALFLIINIDPGENAFPSSEQELEIHTK